MNATSTGSIIIAGHSHVGALFGGVTNGEIRMSPIEGRAGVLGLHGPFPRSEEYWSALTRSAAGNTVALVWQGNEHNYYFLIEQPPPFDFVPARLSSLPVEDDAVIVPETLIRAKLTCFSNHLHQLLMALKQQADCRIVLIGTPPPKGDNEQLHRLLAPEFPYLYHSPEATVEHVSLTRPIIRLKLWHVLQEIYKEQAEKDGGEFIPVPTAATDEIGFLKPEFWADDATHANTKYGQVLLDYLVGKLQR